MQKFLITGGAGFVGSHLAARLLQQRAHVVALDNLSRVGSAQNVGWLRGLQPKSESTFEFVEADVRDAACVNEVVGEHRPDAVFHLAGQVAMTTSVADPRADFETNVAGTIHVLEAVRLHAPESVVVYASSNKVYGNLSHLDLEETPTRYRPRVSVAVDESAPLEFHTPYGCSKGAADQYVLDYARSFGLRTIVFRHSTIYGGRQHATFDQGWVGWFCRQALEVKQHPGRAPFTISGDGKQVRDLLHVTDAAEACLAAFARAQTASGEAFNIGGGTANSMSLLELFASLQTRLDVTLQYDRLSWRLSDQKYFVADIAKAVRMLGWTPQVSIHQGLDEMLGGSLEG
jgi:CDP-paratose 2-epimerase